MKPVRRARAVPRVLAYSLVTSAALCASSTWAQQAAPPPRPNIVFVLTDDQRHDALGYAGNELAHTPHMDALAEAGTYFSHATVTTPICAASRASILSGLYERTHRFNFQSADIPAAYMQDAYPAVLRDAGYHTAFFGKYGVRYPDTEALFDVYDGYDRNTSRTDSTAYWYKQLDGETVHLTRYTGQQALDYLDARAEARDGQPFMLSLSFSAPHAQDRAPAQYFWQPEQADLLADATVPGPALAGDAYFAALPAAVREGFNRTRWHWRYDTPAKYQHSMKGYYRMIAGVDAELGRIRAKLAEHGMAENTVIVVMGDNGYFAGERQLAGKWLLYDNSIRVPLIVYDPRVGEHYDSDVLAQNVDLAPTFADLASAKTPEQWQGVSLMPWVRGERSATPRDTSLIEHLWDFEHIPSSEGVRTERWKYFRYVNDQRLEELYDLRKDPAETRNLVADPKHRSTLAALRAKTDELAARFSDSESAGPTGLHVETIRDPRYTLIYDTQPEFGWHVPVGQDPTAAYQRGYQVLVASSAELLARNVGDVWDSGHVTSGNSTAVSCEPALAQGNTYYWKVRIWDGLNRLTRYSSPQRFTVGTSDKGWVSSGNWLLEERQAPVLAEARTRPDGTAYRFSDFGKAAFGTLEITHTAERSDTLVVRLGEKLSADTVDLQPGGHIRFAERRIAVRPGTHTYPLELVPDRRNTLVEKNAVLLPDTVEVLMPFRYAEVQSSEVQGAGSTSTTRIAYFGYWDETRSEFTSDSDTLDLVYDLCRYSIKATTFSGLYVDGDRERIPYEADAYLEQLSHYTTDQEYAMARQTLEYFFEHPTWPTEWQQHVALMVWADYEYTGDLELAARFYEPLKDKTLMELRDPNGLITSENSDGKFMRKLGFKNPKDTMSDIVDWPPPNWQGNPDVPGERDGYVFERYSTVINALYYENMRIMSALARALGKTDEALEFELRAAEAKRAVNTLLWDESRGRYKDGLDTDHASLHANMFPLAFGMVPEVRQASVVAHVRSRGNAASVYGAQYLLDGLYRAGESQYALDLMRSTGLRSWYNMIREGSTVTMEAPMMHAPSVESGSTGTAGAAWARVIGRLRRAAWRSWRR